MIEVSEKSGNTTPSGGADAPDWSLVPFEVGCARCGHDLRGYCEPRCPACGLEFDWSRALPLDDLKCPGCEYHLLGLSDTRCPECGRAFTWDQVLAAAHRRRVRLFEYQWRDRPLGSLVDTWSRTLRPGRFWRELNIHDPPRPWPLLALAILGLLPFTGLVPFLTGLFGWLIEVFKWGTRPTWAMFLAYHRNALESESTSGFVSFTAAWSVTSLGALLLFRWTMRRFGIRRVQVLRLWAYSIPALPLTLALVAGFLAALLLTLQNSELAFAVRAWVPPACEAFVGAYVIWSIRQGYRHYLRLPHAAAVAVTSQAVAILAALVVWHLALGGHAEYVIDYALWLIGYE